MACASCIVMSRHGSLYAAVNETGLGSGCGLATRAGPGAPPVAGAGVRGWRVAAGGGEPPLLPQAAHATALCQGLAGRRPGVAAGSLGDAVGHRRLAPALAMIISAAVMPTITTYRRIRFSGGRSSP
jgi:hypothetical protein